MADAPPPPLTAGYATYSGGCHAGARNSRELAENQVAHLVNGTVRGGWVTHRDGFREIPLKFHSAEDKGVFEGGKFQGDEYYDGRVAYAIDGRLFTVDPVTGWVSRHGFGGVPQPLSRRVDFIHLEQRDGYLVCQDGVNVPVLLEGTRARRSDFSRSEVFTGSLMADGWGRLALCSIDRTRIYFSDHELDPTSDSRRFTEMNDYYLASRYFQPPRRIGKLVALELIPFVDAPAGFGPLIAFGENGAVTYDLSYPRSDGGWVRTNIERMTLLNIGACGHRSTIATDNDLLFRDQFGRLRLLSQSIKQQEHRKNAQRVRQFDREVLPWIERETPQLRKWLDAVSHSDRYLWTCLPVATRLPDGRRDVTAAGMLAFNLDVLANLRGEEEPAWDGLWTGIRPQALTSGIFDGEPRLLILSRDSDGVRRVYEQKRGQKTDVAWSAEAGRRVPKRIEWQVGTRWFDFKTPFLTKSLTVALIRIGAIVGRVTIEGFARRSEEGCWEKWFVQEDGTNSEVEIVYDCECRLRESGPGEIERLALPSLPWPGSQFHRLQIMLRITGSCELRDLALEARPVGGDAISDQTQCDLTELRRVEADCWDDLSYDAVAAPPANPTTP